MNIFCRQRGSLYFAFDVQVQRGRELTFRPGRSFRSVRSFLTVFLVHVLLGFDRSFLFQGRGELREFAQSRLHIVVLCS